VCVQNIYIVLRKMGFGTLKFGRWGFFASCPTDVCGGSQLLFP